MIRRNGCQRRKLVSTHTSATAALTTLGVNEMAFHDLLAITKCPMFTMPMSFLQRPKKPHLSHHRVVFHALAHCIQ